MLESRVLYREEEIYSNKYKLSNFPFLYRVSKRLILILVGMSYWLFAPDLFSTFMIHFKIKIKFQLSTICWTVGVFVLFAFIIHFKFKKKHSCVYLLVFLQVISPSIFELTYAYVGSNRNVSCLDVVHKLRLQEKVGK